MSDQSPSPLDPEVKAVQDVAEAHRLLRSLRDELNQHPKLEQAIVKLELALETLTLKSGGML